MPDNAGRAKGRLGTPDGEVLLVWIELGRCDRPLGAALATRCRYLGWIEPLPDSRAVAISAAGRRGFAETFGISAVGGEAAEPHC